MDTKFKFSNLGKFSLTCNTLKIHHESEHFFKYYSFIISFHYLSSLPSLSFGSKIINLQKIKNQTSNWIMYQRTVKRILKIFNQI